MWDKITYPLKFGNVSGNGNMVGIIPSNTCCAYDDLSMLGLKLDNASKMGPCRHRDDNVLVMYVYMGPALDKIIVWKLQTTW